MNWLRDKLRKMIQRDAPPGAFAGAFGKHPGWDDHAEDLPLPSDALVEFKRRLYNEGVSRNVDSGEWSGGEAQGVLPSFAHVVLWCAGQHRIASRIWSSVDGKGRASYPMIVALHLQGPGAARATRSALELVRRAEDRFRAADNAGAVRLALADLQAEASATLAGELAAPGPPAVDPLARFDEQLGTEPLARVLYELEAVLGGDGRSSASRATATARVPLKARTLSEALDDWTAYAVVHLDDEPLHVVAPLEHAWVDLIAGAASTSQFRCLREGPSRVPLTTDVPYALDPQFIRAVQARVNDARNGSSARRR